MTREELWVTIDIAGKPVNILIAIYSVLTAYSGPVNISSETSLVVGINRAPGYGLILSYCHANSLYFRKK